MDIGNIISLINLESDKEEEKVDITVFEVFEDEFEIKQMDISEFKQKAKDVGLTVEENINNDIINNFEVVEE
jgi:hypothetical protein